MPTPQEDIKRIQEKLIKLVARYTSLLKENEQLKKTLHDITTQTNILKEKNDQLSLQVNMMQLAETTDAKEAKLALEKKLNAFIKEIDRCIAILGDQT